MKSRVGKSPVQAKPDVRRAAKAADQAEAMDAATLGPAETLLALDRVGGPARAQLVTRLQRTHGNTFVHGVVTREGSTPGPNQSQQGLRVMRQSQGPQAAVVTTVRQAGPQDRTDSVQEAARYLAAMAEQIVDERWPAIEALVEAGRSREALEAMQSLARAMAELTDRDPEAWCETLASSRGVLYADMLAVAGWAGLEGEAERSIAECSAWDEQAAEFLGDLESTEKEQDDV